MKRDIAFLVDGSDNTRRGFQALRDFLYSVISELTIGVNDNRIAVIQYSNVAVANFHLNSFLRKEDVLNAVKGLIHKGGRPLNTGSALQYVNNDIFTETSGSRKHEGVPQILILMSGGRSKDSINEPVTTLSHAGVSIIGIGTQNSDIQDLPKISPEITSFIVDDYNDLPNIKQKIIVAVESDVLKGTTKKESVVGESCPCHIVHM